MYTGPTETQGLGRYAPMLCCPECLHSDWKRPDEGKQFLGWKEAPEPSFANAETLEDAYRAACFRCLKCGEPFWYHDPNKTANDRIELEGGA